MKIYYKPTEMSARKAAGRSRAHDLFIARGVRRFLFLQRFLQLNRDLPYITPIDKIPINTTGVLKHPVFWVFKGEELIDTNIIRKSKAYRNLVDAASSKNGIVKMFERGKDAKYFRDGDYGVYMNSRGEDIIKTFKKIGKRLEPFKLDFMVPNEDK